MVAHTEAIARARVIAPGGDNICLSRYGYSFSHWRFRMLQVRTHVTREPCPVGLLRVSYADRQGSRKHMRYQAMSRVEGTVILQRGPLELHGLGILRRHHELNRSLENRFEQIATAAGGPNLQFGIARYLQSHDHG